MDEECHLVPKGRILIVITWILTARSTADGMRSPSGRRGDIRQFAFCYTTAYATVALKRLPMHDFSDRLPCRPDDTARRPSFRFTHLRRSEKALISCGSFLLTLQRAVIGGLVLPRLTWLT